MPDRLNVYALPQLADPEELADGTAVVMDVLRASTTIVYALEAGADEVIPCLEVGDAWKVAAGLRSHEMILGGERGGLPIEGFDLGNSPEDYTPERVAGKTLVFTTTNGTRAMLHAKAARRILIGAFVNASAVCEQLDEAGSIHLICAGTEGQISQDDVLLAGLLVDRLQRRSGDGFQLNAQAATARETWLSCFPLPLASGAEPLPAELLAVELRRSLGGQNLVRVGLDADILAAARIDLFAGVAELDRETLRIGLA